MTRSRDGGGRGTIAASPSGVSGEIRTDAVRSTTLDNGVRVLSERIPGVRSVSVGVWLLQGGAHEASGALGESHLLEHMVFKGTERRTPREIALALEGLGGSLDAYTTREHTSFQARVLDEHLPEAMDVVADLVLRPLLREEDLELEREVVLEEIAQVFDTPDDLVFELHGTRLWEGHPYGHPILGSRETVSAITAARLRDLHRARYRGRSLIVAAAGNTTHEQVLELARRHFGDVPAGEAAPAIPEPPPSASGTVAVPRDTAQTHVVTGCATVAHSDERRIPLVLLSQAFGGGMSSRLFQRIREELALAYTVFSYQSFYTRGGVCGVYLGTRPGWEQRALEALAEELERVGREGLDAEELEQTRQQVKGQIMLSLESTGARLYRLAGFALHDEPWLDLDGLLARVDAVTRDQVADAAAEFYAPSRQLVLTLGPEGASGPVRSAPDALPGDGAPRAG
jgi:predicted Zn-dependent peptidase